MDNDLKCVVCKHPINYDEVSPYSAYGGLPSPCCKICFEVNDYSIKSIEELQIKSLLRRAQMEEKQNDEVKNN